ncbi:MAG TPA: IPT/TIG domain-containing protein [Kofleriaceae bacterium]|nr:IPT/TIG domain-containing protein [Kofleriaceae bacterium]
MRLSTCLPVLSGLVFAIGCSSDKKPPPQITAIVPDPICSDGTGFTIKGANFDEDAAITVDGAPVQGAMVTDAMNIIVTVAAGTATAGDHMVTVTNPDHASATDTLTGEAKPLMFFVDPNVLGANMTARMNVYMSGLTTMIRSMSVQQHTDSVPNGNPAVALTEVSAVTGHANQVQGTVTAGTLGAGQYDVSVSDGVCTATLPSGLTIVGTPDITIASVNPPFGSPDDNTAITVTASGYALNQTPRVFLSSGGTATALSAVSWQSATSVTAVVPRNALPAGDYDVIVVDPLDAQGGHVGVLGKGFHLIATPPVVRSVTAQTVIASQPATLVVAGSGFATGSTPTAWLSECSAPPGITTPVTPFALPAISGATPTQLNVPVAASTMAAGVVCVLRIINGAPTDARDPCPAGGTCLPYADFSAIASVNGSGNLGTWVQSSASSSDVRELPGARTRLGVVAGHVNDQTRFLYALGGDDGSEANATREIVSTQLSPLGDMLGWSAQRTAMLTPRTGQATIRIGQFLYALGGFDGSAVLRSVERARILDPLDVPAAPEIDLTPSAAGLSAGTWVYRITGVRGPAYASDPDGETLPSDPLNVTLPDLTGMAATPRVKVTLTWPAMQDVVSYNVYRTGTTGQDVTQVQLIASVPQAAGPSVKFDDTGLATSATTPLPIGALGKWHAVGELTTPRYGAAAAIAHGMTTATTDTFFLYVGGGAGDTALTQTGLLDTYEWARVDIAAADGSQTVSAFSLGKSGSANASIGGARAFLSAYSSDATVKSEIPVGTTFVYFGTGMDRPAAALALKSGMAAGSLTPASPTGDLGTMASLTAAPVGGAGAATIAGFLFTIGGWNSGLTIQNTSSATFCPTSGCASTQPPVLTNWNNGGGGTPNVPRVLLGAVVEAPFIYIFGGSTTSAATSATKSTERTVW